jgi:hypothetical protein
VVLLTKTDEEGGAWYPVSIAKLEKLLVKVITTGHGYEHSYALRKNIAYNLQYFEFQDRTIQDIKMSSVIHTQSVKSMVMVGSSVVESIMHFLLIMNDVHTKTEWREKSTFKGNQKNFDGAKVRIDSVVLEKLPKPIPKHMSYDAMIKCAKSKHIFGSHPAMYQKLENPRVARNKVHLQVINNPNDTDWNTFRMSHLSDVCKVLYAILTSSLFSPSEHEKDYFEYLRRNFVS